MAKKTDPKKKASTQVNATNSALAANGAKKVKSDKDGVVKKSLKKYNVSVSKRAKASEKDFRMQDRREKELESDIKKAGGITKYLDEAKAARKRVKKNPTRR